MSRPRIAVIPPRYGDEVVGGAETVLSEVAHGLAARGWDVEVLTTCAADHYTWANHYPAGETHDGDVIVRRFPTVLDTPGKLRDRIGSRILGGETISIVDQQLWINDSLRVPELYHHVLDRSDSFDIILCGPYMFWTTFAVGQIAPDRTVLMPCLHDEPTARLELFQPMFSGARGVFFLSDPEAELAAELFRLPVRTDVVGSAISIPDRYETESFRERHGLDGPFIYYAGRREWGKGWQDLLAAFTELINDGEDRLRLVTSGVGEPGAPDSASPYVVDLGFVSDDERNAAMAAASAYVQPSAMESFSRTVLEAWLAGTPVIASAASAVVSWHVERSDAGLLYRTSSELVEALRLVAEAPDALAELAGSGRSYVIEHYEPEAVLDRMDQLLRSWSEREASS